MKFLLGIGSFGAIAISFQSAAELQRNPLEVQRFKTKHGEGILFSGRGESDIGLAR